MLRTCGGGPVSATWAQSWRDDALCREVDPEAFFPPRGGSARPAKRICARCPSIAPCCLTEALSYPASDDYGIRGGLSERERKRIRQQTRTPATVTALPLPAVAERDLGEAA